MAVVEGLPVLAGRASTANTGTGTVSMTLQSPATLDAAQVSSVQASDYELRADGLGGFQLFRLNGGSVDPQYAPQAVANGDLVDGFLISIGGAAAAGDRFLLQPAASAARDIHVDISNPKLIAAASPLSATLAVGNLGTGSVASLVADSATAGTNPNLPATLSFQATATPGQFAYTWQDGTGTSAPVVWQPGQAIDYPGSTPTDGFTITITGVPAAGDSFSILRNTYPQADNRNANAMLSLRDAPLVGAIWSGASLQPGTDVTDAYANILGNIGVRVQSARAAADLSTAVADDAELSRSSRSGVNLDEEAARLIQYQQSYQAAAKMLQVAQSIFETLLQTAR
ncbi:MAG TPA: flagellar basal body rod C-terminal domain-containing protein [Phycisphaerae bacterium]|nr:flagellar basal body rod C-terminal domain-containing protein [Phycisphaerae bacterium]